MNENEPKVDMPEPPAGHRWDYRGMGWKIPEPRHHAFALADATGEPFATYGTTTGFPDYHYWEAVLTPVNRESADQSERYRRPFGQPQESGEIDHTEGGKYRMLEEGEKLEPSDQYFWHDRKEWDSVYGYAGYDRPFSKAFWGSDVRRRIDFAQQAKDTLQARFVVGFPAFREIALDRFVDLIIKAAKQ
jgi:hypothetical protein